MRDCKFMNFRRTYSPDVVSSRPSSILVHSDINYCTSIHFETSMCPSFALSVDPCFILSSFFCNLQLCNCFVCESCKIWLQSHISSELLITSAMVILMANQNWFFCWSDRRNASIIEHTGGTYIKPTFALQGVRSHL